MGSETRKRKSKGGGGLGEEKGVRDTLKDRQRTANDNEMEKKESEGHEEIG